MTEQDRRDRANAKAQGADFIESISNCIRPVMIAGPPYRWEGEAETKAETVHFRTGRGPDHPIRISQADAGEWSGYYRLADNGRWTLTGFGHGDAPGEVIVSCHVNERVDAHFLREDE